MAPCLESGFFEFKLDFEGTKALAIGDCIISDDFSAGGNLWRVHCYPHGDEEEDHGVYLSLYLQLVRGSKKVKAIFQPFLLRRDGTPSPSIGNMLDMELYRPEAIRSELWGYKQFEKQSRLESNYVKDGKVIFMIGVIVQQPEHPIPVPASDIAGHLGGLLDHTDGSDDVTFSVGGEMFHAHKAVLAGRSPVFKAQLFGSMEDAKMPCITLHEIMPATFQILLRFMYTDELDEETQSSSNIDLFMNLLAAADKYHLDRLKLMCAHKLWDCLSAENVNEVLRCAEMYNCSELKKACMDFFVRGKNFKTVVLKDGYFKLYEDFPSVIEEIRKRRT